MGRGQRGVYGRGEYAPRPSERERALKAAAEETAQKRAALAREEGREEKKLGFEGERLGAYKSEVESQQAERKGRGEREALALPSEISSREAQAAQARAGAAENYAQAALAGRTDPNLRGGGGGLGGASGGGYDVRAAMARKAQLVAAGVDPTRAEAQAFQEQDAVRQQESPREAVQKRFQSKLDSVYGIADDAMRKKFLEESIAEVQALDAMYQQSTARPVPTGAGPTQMPAQPSAPAPQAQPFAAPSASPFGLPPAISPGGMPMQGGPPAAPQQQMIGKTVPIAVPNGPPIQARVTAVNGNKATLTFPDGTVKYVDVNKLR